MDVKILNKDQSFAKLNDVKFISEWKSLSQQSSDFSLIQEYGFAYSWYTAYKNTYDPILVLAYNHQNKLVGILPLAQHQQRKSLSHAGDDQAEYAGWVCQQGLKAEFLTRSLIALKKEFNLHKWQWGWLPPQASTEWLSSKELKEQGITANISTYESPLYDLSDPARIRKVRKGGSIKSNFNRLKRTGDLRIERITDMAVAKEIFIDLKKKANFRNLAVYNNFPFEDDKNKEQWHLDHLNSGEGVHFTVLWHGDELLACNFGFCTDDTVMMGLVAYNPVQGSRSPGSVFLIMLIEFLMEEGFHYLDLTPGGDPYKERFCNRHQTLHKVVFCFSKTCKISDDVANYVKNKIKQKYSYRDLVQIKSSLETKLKQFINKPKQLLHPEGALFRCDANISPTQTLELRTQQYDDLLLYKPQRGDKSHKDIVFSALRNFEREDRLYSLLKDGELVLFVWVSTSGRKHWNETINQLSNITQNKALLYDFYCHNTRDNEALVTNFLQSVIRLIKVNNTDEAYFVKPSVLSHKQMEAMDFSPVCLKALEKVAVA